jgi:transposase-like protein
VFSNMQDRTDIRRAVLVQGASKRSVCRQYGIAHKTLQKILAHSEPGSRGGCCRRCRRGQSRGRSTGR